MVGLTRRELLIDGPAMVAANALPPRPSLQKERNIQRNIAYSGRPPRKVVKILEPARSTEMKGRAGIQLRQSEQTYRGSQWTTFVVRRVILLVMVIAMVFTVGCGGSTTSRPTTTPPVINKALWGANGTNHLEVIPAESSSPVPTMAPHLANNSGSFSA